MGTKEQKAAEVNTTHRNANTTTTTMATAPEAEAAAAAEDTTRSSRATTPTRKNNEEEAIVVFDDEIVTQQKLKETAEKKTTQANGERKEHQSRQQQQMPRGLSSAAPLPPSSPSPSPTPPPLPIQPPSVRVIPSQQASALATNAAKKIRRAFSMPRNPFRWSRKFKTAIATNAAGSDISVGRSNNNITSCVGGGRGRSGSIVSLNSYEAFVCKDSNGNAMHDAATTTTTTQTAEITTTTAKATSATTTSTTVVESSTAANHNKRNTAPARSGSSGNGNGNDNDYGNGERKTGNHARVLRRSSFRKFLHRIAQHLSSSVSINNVGAKKQSTSSIAAAAAAATATSAAAATAITASAATGGTAERVPPISGVYQWPTDQTPGVMGLKNHGNTCFMNAVLQCLSHTDILAEYFVLDQYKVDLKRRNKINSRKFGTKGELTEQLANVLKALWTCKNESDHSTGFKAVVDRYGSQFRSSTQHDAQEFLFWLLDKVHEDLNTATKRRYKSVKNNYGRPDEVIAAETLANHIRCNNSFVQAVFQAQFRSSLTCPRCQKQSNTFDPFHCISVQLPQLAQRTIFVTVVYIKHKPQQMKLGVTVPAGSPIVALREQLHTDTGIAMDCMVLVDLNAEGFTRVFYDMQPIETLKGIETVYCIEVPQMTQLPSATATATATATAAAAATATTIKNTKIATKTSTTGTGTATTVAPMAPVSIANSSTTQTTANETAAAGTSTSTDTVIATTTMSATSAGSAAASAALKVSAAKDVSAGDGSCEAGTSGCSKSLATATHATDLLLLVANVYKKQKKSAAATVSVRDAPVAATDNAAKGGIGGGGGVGVSVGVAVQPEQGEQAKMDEYTYEPFSAPFSMKAPRDCSYMELQKRMLREMSPLLKPEVFSYATPLMSMFQIRLQDPSADPDTYLEQVEHPLLTEIIDMALSVLSSEAGPPHVKLLLEWTAPEDYFVSVSGASEAVVEHESVARLNARKSNDTAALTLEQCLEHYTKAETLSAEDAWRCPHCQQYLPVVKTLGLWSLPDILVVHFKRFRQHQEKGPQAAKLTTMVKFPLHAFDMSPHLARDMNAEVCMTNLEASAANGGTNYRPSPWRKMRTGSDSRSSTLNSRAEQRDTRYDLYAVCYHQGDTLETGHYTAACKNPYDRQWYKFDDQRVSKVPEHAIQEEIINNEAYMLFYQRRTVDTAVECSGSSSNSGDHWISRIAPPTVPTLVVGVKEKSQEKIEVGKPPSQQTPAAAAAAAASTAPPEEEPQSEHKDRLQSKPVEIPKVCNEIEEDDMLPYAPDSEMSKQAAALISNSASTAATATALAAAKCELLNIEELDYADADAADTDADGGGGGSTVAGADAGTSADADVNANDAHHSMTNATTVSKVMCSESTKDDSANSNPDASAIFLMDEEFVALEPPAAAAAAAATVLKATTPKLSIDISIDKASDIVAAMASEVFTSIRSGPGAIAAAVQNNGAVTATINSKISPHDIKSHSASNTTSGSSSSSSTTSLSSSSTPHSLAVSVHAASSLQSKFNGYASNATNVNCNGSHKEIQQLSSSLKSQSGSMSGTTTSEFCRHNLHNQQHYYQSHNNQHNNWHGSRSSVSAVENATQQTQRQTTSLKLRHSFSTSSNYKLRECSETLSSLLRNSTNTCSKDTLLFIDQQTHHHGSLIEDESDSYMGRSLWISPVTPHKLITVSPKN